MRLEAQLAVVQISPNTEQSWKLFTVSESLPSPRGMINLPDCNLLGWGAQVQGMLSMDISLSKKCILMQASSLIKIWPTVQSLDLSNLRASCNDIRDLCAIKSLKSLVIETRCVKWGLANLPKLPSLELSLARDNPYEALLLRHLIDLTGLGLTYHDPIHKVRLQPSNLHNSGMTISFRSEVWYHCLWCTSRLHLPFWKYARAMKELHR